MNLTLEQQLLSARFRVALRQAVEGGDTNDADLVELVTSLAGGDFELGMVALGHLIDACNARNDVALNVLALFLEGHLDVVVGIRDAEFAWVSTELGAEAFG